MLKHFGKRGGMTMLIVMAMKTLTGYVDTLVDLTGVVATQLDNSWLI